MDHNLVSPQNVSHSGENKIPWGNPSNYKENNLSMITIYLLRSQHIWGATRVCGSGEHEDQVWRSIGIARSIVTPFLCPSRGPICVSCDWLVALGVMGLKKVVIVLCGWAGVAVFFNNFSRCLLSSSKKSPRHRWSSYSITLRRKDLKSIWDSIPSIWTRNK